MRMMPRAVPCASVSIYNICALHKWVGRVEQVSEIVRCWFSGSPKNSTKREE